MVEPAPDFEAVPRTRRDVTNNVNFVPSFFCFAELFNQPLKLPTWVSAVDQQPAKGGERERERERETERDREREREREVSMFREVTVFSTH